MGGTLNGRSLLVILLCRNKSWNIINNSPLKICVTVHLSTWRHFRLRNRSRQRKRTFVEMRDPPSEIIGNSAALLHSSTQSKPLNSSATSELNQISELGMTLYLFSINRGKTTKPSEEEPSLATPLKPIPMPYQTLKQPPLE